MERWEKKIWFDDHSLKQCLARGFDRSEIRQAIKSGVIKRDEKRPRNNHLCIYKQKNQVYSIAFVEGDEAILIKTVYPAGPRELEWFKEEKNE